MASSNTLPPGWEWGQRRIALPTEMVRKLEQEHRDAQARAEAAERLAEEQEDAQNGNRSDECDDTDWPSSIFKSGEPCLKVLSKEQVEAADASSESLFTESDKRARARALFKVLRAAGEYRKLVRLPPNWRKIIHQLERRFPNFIEVLNYFRSMFALAEHSDGTIQFSPVLLAGPPGVGKSYFCEAFAKALGVHLVCMRMENAQSNAGLAGSEEFWSNTQPGRLFDSLVNKFDANPLFFLDEIDKVSTEGRYDPMSSLLSLLEPRTASSFYDLSFPWLNLDASRVLWICTANDVTLLTEPIRSRLKSFEIPSLTKVQSRRVAAKLFVEIRREIFGAKKTFSIQREAFNSIETLAPREMRRVLQESIGWALFNSRMEICARDVEVALNLRTERWRFGFAESL